jgi:RNA polymerase sigma-70 factor (ECF subfamily)
LASERDKDASPDFEALYNRYYDPVLRVCVRRLHDRHEAEDVAQETFVRAWKALSRFSGEQFYPWLLVIANNACIDALRRRQQVATGQEPAPVSSAEEAVFTTVDRELVDQALARLSTRHRRVLAMREEWNWTNQQIAQHEGVSIGAVEVLVWRARQALKRQFIFLTEIGEVFAGVLIVAAAFLRRLAHRVSQCCAGLSGGETISGAVATGTMALTVFVVPVLGVVPANEETAAPATPRVGEVKSSPPMKPPTPPTAPQTPTSPVNTKPMPMQPDPSVTAAPVAAPPVVAAPPQYAASPPPTTTPTTAPMSPGLSTNNLTQTATGVIQTLNNAVGTVTGTVKNIVQPPAASTTTTPSALSQTLIQVVNGLTGQLSP